MHSLQGNRLTEWASMLHPYSVFSMAHYLKLFAIALPL